MKLSLGGALFLAAIFLLIILSVRLIAILPPCRPQAPRRSPNSPTHLLVVLGSGGHTAEMLTFLQRINPQRFTYRRYIVSEGDSFSAVKAAEFETRLMQKSSASSNYLPTETDSESTQSIRWNANGQCRDNPEIVEDPGISHHEHLSTMPVRASDSPPSSPSLSESFICPPDNRVKGSDTGSYTIHIVPRARRVHQPLFTTPFSALKCLVSCLWLLYSPPSSWDPNVQASNPKAAACQVPHYPNLILTNGPGTAVIVVLASVLLRLLNVRNADAPDAMRTIYVESWARVKRLSLSGKILVRVVDRFFVQWEGLAGAGGRAEYVGWVVL